MTFRAIAARLGIESYPEALDQLWEQNCRFPACDREFLDSLENTYALFGPVYPVVLEAAEAIRQNPDRLNWVETASYFALHGSLKDARSIPVPEGDGTLASDLMALFLLLPMIPDSIKTYRQNGIPEEELPRYVTVYRGGMEVIQRQTGRYGMNRMYYAWSCLYAKSEIFNHGGYNFEFRTMPDGALYLKHRHTGEIAVVLCGGAIHATGYALGSAGCEDPEGSWTADLREDDTAWYGFTTERGKALPDRRCFPKDEWVCILRPGDDVLSIHIPRGTDLTAPSTDAAVAGALKIVAEHYPQFHVRGIYCRSWLLEPALQDMLGSESRIPAFGNRFHRYPAKDPGKDVFGFLFPKCHQGLETLPENTRLERLAKARYLAGSYIYAWPGVMFPTTLDDTPV